MTTLEVDEGRNRSKGSPSEESTSLSGESSVLTVLIALSCSPFEIAEMTRVRKRHLKTMHFMLKHFCLSWRLRLLPTFSDPKKRMFDSSVSASKRMAFSFFMGCPATNFIVPFLWKRKAPLNITSTMLYSYLYVLTSHKQYGLRYMHVRTHRYN